MGGIGGVRVFSGGPVAAEELRDMTERLRHRGPDASGTWTGDGVGLTHTRMAIIDEQHSRQPMQSADGRWVVVLDGEIVNHDSLRTQLSYPFGSHGDTEVVVAGLSIEGISFVERLRGQFALVAHDRRTDTTHLVRDRLGILPLHYRHVPGGIAFASEVKALLTIGPTPGVDHRSLDTYLATHYVPAPDTLFEGVKKVRPAHRVSVMPGGHLEEVQYWTPPESDADGTWTASDAVEAVGDGVREAVRGALVADVPVGAYLSGDLGSALTVAQMRQLRGDEPVHTFSAGLGAPTDDDRASARRVSELLGTRHHEVHVHPHELEELWSRLTWHRDAPISDLADVAAFGLARAAREHVGVVLSGDGGEELFGGHGRYRYARFAERTLALPAPMRSRLAGSVQRRMGAPFTAAERHRLLGAAAPAERRTSPALGSDAVDRMLRHDLRHDLPDHLLERSDRMSKAASLEVRPALLDHRLVELAFRLPTSLKVRAGSTQWVLREVARPLLPDEVIDPRRSASRPDLAGWMRDGLRRGARDRLTGSGSWVAQTLDRSLVGDLVDRHERGDRTARDVDVRLWTLLALETWHECFFGTPPTLPLPRQASPAVTRVPTS
ncbi:asparagine synthase (glutamine-hydrolyzing) [Nocardioides oleivorans]|uniref:asparagine synthase (glutamine-hydrolyzing) n=1 Tax=Nocardioides oleivorans TaxID=273676 RepID=A0A4Q2S3B8_9ACTN|nr:asparagine synthase (glutamine-hydrolyzing) [Nocardioides oleivorans]RYB94914.1 asparagine synthase (glutamine-hydrolyzing) [Nocardioides oleivorans]